MKARLVVLIALAAGAIACGLAPAATPATRPSAGELHAQAAELMRKDQLDRAGELMDQAFAQTPAAERQRPLVLNRAILDLRQRLNAMRAVREVHRYLSEHPEPDEQAHDILGAALNIAAESPRVKSGAVWQAAFREWERRNDEMNASRPGYRRWGTRWLDEQQFREMENGRAELERAVDDQTERVDRAMTRCEALRFRYQALSAADAAERDRLLGQWEEQRQLNDARRGYEQRLRGYEAQKRAWEQWQRRQQQQQQRPVTGHQPRAPLSPPPQTATPQQQPAPASSGGGGRRPTIVIPTNPGTVADAGAFTPASQEERARIASEIIVAEKDLQAEQARLTEVKRSLLAANRPQWPTTFDPIELTATAPPPLPPPDPDAVAAMAERATAASERATTPFAGSGTLTKRQPFAPLETPAPNAQPTTAPAGEPAAPPGVPFAPRNVDRVR